MLARFFRKKPNPQNETIAKDNNLSKSTVATGKILLDELLISTFSDTDKLTLDSLALANKHLHSIVVAIRKSKLNTITRKSWSEKLQLALIITAENYLNYPFGIFAPHGSQGKNRARAIIEITKKFDSENEFNLMGLILLTKVILTIKNNLDKNILLAEKLMLCIQKYEIFDTKNTPFSSELAKELLSQLNQKKIDITQNIIKQLKTENRIKPPLDEEKLKTKMQDNYFYFYEAIKAVLTSKPSLLETILKLDFKNLKFGAMGEENSDDIKTIQDLYNSLSKEQSASFVPPALTFLPYNM